MSKPLTMTDIGEPHEWTTLYKARRAALALRAALAAAEAARDEATSLLADTRASIHWAEVEALKANLADERKHADALADKLSILALGRINRTEVTAHFARRNAEKEDKR